MILIFFRFVPCWAASFSGWEKNRVESMSPKKKSFNWTSKLIFMNVCLLIMQNWNTSAPRLTDRDHIKFWQFCVNASVAPTPQLLDSLRTMTFMIELLHKKNLTSSIENENPSFSPHFFVASSFESIKKGFHIVNLVYNYILMPESWINTWTRWLHLRI